MLTRRRLLEAGLAAVGVAALGGCENEPAEVAAPTVLPTPVPVPTDTPTPSPTLAPTSIATPTATPSPTATPILSPTPTVTTAPTAIATPIPSAVPTSTANPTSTATHTPTTGNPDVPVVDLALPFDLADLAWRSGEFVSPFGVVRKSQDRAALGHGGIDIPLKLGAPIYAVAAGRLISVEPSVDFRPGDVVVLLLQHGVRPGEAWVFLYEHITLEPDIAVGTSVARGQLMGRNAMPTGVSNHHPELAYAFNEYRFTMSKTCWVHQLETGARTALIELFENTIRVSEVFVEGWRTATDEGPLPE